jgi:hypothetical protein
MTRLQRAVLAATMIAISLCSPAGACSMCRCGDPLFNSLGTDLFAGPRFRLALDHDRTKKEQGPADERERLTESRLTATLAWAPSDRFQMVVRVPWSERSLREGDAATSASGMADPEISGIVRVWKSGWADGMGIRSWISVVGGVKTDWGENAVERQGERLDEHVQPGTGSVDPFLGLSGLHQLTPKSSLYGSLQARRPGRNDSGYRYGRILLANLGYERKLSDRFDVGVELNARHAGRDEIDSAGDRDDDTGGAIAYLSPRLLVALTPRLVGRLAVLVPAWDDLNGDQEEKPVVSLGLTASF